MNRIELNDYLRIRQAVIDANYGEDIDWSESLLPPKDADSLANEAIFVICNSGMQASTGRMIYGRVMKSIRDGKSAFHGLRHRHKAASIDEIWKSRQPLFDAFAALESDADRLAWCDRLPHIGGITKFHVAKNLGVNVAKPDRHLERLAIASGESVQGLCERLSREHGDRIATVDVVLWRACSLGIIESRNL